MAVHDAPHDSSDDGLFDAADLEYVQVSSELVPDAGVNKTFRACVDTVAFPWLSAQQFPDFRSFARFRKRHLAALGNVFLQALELCRAAGMLFLGQVALDGTKVRARIDLLDGADDQSTGDIGHPIGELKWRGKVYVVLECVALGRSFE